jgi:hypothetical protein
MARRRRGELSASPTTLPPHPDRGSIFLDVEYFFNRNPAFALKTIIKPLSLES